MATLVFQPIRPPHRYVNGEMGKIFVCYCHCFLFKIMALFSFGPISQAKRRWGRPPKSSQTPPPPHTVSQVIISYYIHFVVLFSFLIMPFFIIRQRLVIYVHRSVVPPQRTYLPDACIRYVRYIQLIYMPFRPLYFPSFSPLFFSIIFLHYFSPLFFSIIFLHYFSPLFFSILIFRHFTAGAFSCPWTSDFPSFSDTSD